MHRTKNAPRVVQSLARRTAARAETKEEMIEALTGRMSPVAKALSSVIESGSGADGGAVLRLEWSEREVPHESQTERSGEGLGPLLLMRAVPMQLRAEVSSELWKEGYRYALDIPPASLAPRERPGRIEDFSKAFSIANAVDTEHRSARATPPLDLRPAAGAEPARNFLRDEDLRR